MIREIDYIPPINQSPLPKRVGLIALATDATIEGDFRRLIGSNDIAIHVNRIRFKNPTTPENLRSMRPHIAEAAAMILPGEQLDSIIYGCTSASVVIGEDSVRQAVSEGKGNVNVITPAAAASSALVALSAKRITIVTPYVKETAEPMTAYFAERGFQVQESICLNMDDDRQMARIPASEIARLVSGLVDPDLDAVFISCTAFPAAQAVEAIEQVTGVPVVTSNLAAAWVTLRRCGVSADPRSPLRLLTLPQIH